MILNILSHITNKPIGQLSGTFAILLFATFFTINTKAQRPHCHTDEMMHQHLAEQNATHELEEYKHFLNNITPSRDASQVFLIPMVVHVIHNGENEGTGTNTSDARILEQIDILNEDFNRANTDRGQIPTEFADRAANIQFQFCLADIDPDGNATSGITRTRFLPFNTCLLYTSPSPRDATLSRMPSSA